MRITGIEHVQLAMPQGEEQRARDFYSRILEITEVPKPSELAQRGGVWFENQFENPPRRRRRFSPGS